MVTYLDRPLENHSTLAAEARLSKGVAIVAPERDFDLLDLSVRVTRKDHNMIAILPPFKPWYEDEDVRMFLPRESEWWGRR